jgi:predicted ATPase/class 3 adenylate cyclase
MAELPHGTVTFLFTDIEGSTRLLMRLRGGYAEVLGEHRRLLRAAFAVHDGREVNTEGDAFFVAFASASDAIAAAVDAQRALASSGWPEGAEVRVRMGVHSGEADVRMDEYVGLDVHRAARICAVGHGGQVLISSSTRELVAGALPADVALRDLGEHRLKDLDGPERLYQLVAPGLPAAFPSLRTMPARRDRPGGLPALPDRTIGREQEARTIAGRLGREGVRLLTLTGPGGVGKTRLAVDAASQVDSVDGPHFVSLAALHEAEEVPPALVQALGIVAQPGETADESVRRVLSGKHVLLVLDNVEHILTAAPFVADLLSACPGLAVLATSREPLGLAGEERHQVDPLRVPARLPDAGLVAVADAPAVALFARRAAAHDPAFALSADNASAVVEICRRLDGLPLAIELAAARCALLSPAEIAERLGCALAVLGRGPRDAPARQRTLRATIDWSYALLGDAERALFARFAVFAGGATIGATETVTEAALDTIDGLVAKSLLVCRQAAGAPTRLVMLETIRAFADERFRGAGDHDDVCERQYRYFLALLERHGARRALSSAARRAHLAVLDAEIDNVHAALRWALRAPDRGSAILIAAGLADYWLARNRFGDAMQWIDRALDAPGADAHPLAQARALCAKGWCMHWLGRRAEQSAATAAAEAIARRIGDPVALSEVLVERADHEASVGRPETAVALADEALRYATAADDRWSIAVASRARAPAAATLDELRRRVDRAASALEEVGNVIQLAWLLSGASYLAIRMGSARDARHFVERAMRLAGDLDDVEWAMTQGNFALAALLTGDTDAARRAFREELRVSRELVVNHIACEGLIGLAAVAVVCGQTERAGLLYGAAQTHTYVPQDDVVQTLDEAYFNAARRRYGPHAWDRAVRRGRALSLGDAIAYALTEKARAAAQRGDDAAGQLASADT